MVIQTWRDAYVDLVRESEAMIVNLVKLKVNWARWC